MKNVITFVVVVLMCFVFCINASAEKTDDIYNDIYKGIEEGIDSNISDELREYDVDVEDYSTVNNLEISDIFNKIIASLTANIGQAVKIIVKIILLIVLCSVIKSCIPDSDEINEVFSYVSVITVSVVIMNTLMDCIDISLNALNGMNTFMNCYVPVFTSILITSGGITSGNVYYAVMFAICELVSLIANIFIIPVLSIVLCLSVVGAMNEDFPFHKAADGLKKLIQWILGCIMTIVVAVLSIKTLIGVSADNVATRSAKYVVSTFVPVVGSSVSEAFMTVRGSFGVIRSGVGGIGIVILLFLIIPPVSNVVVIRLSVKICEIIADMFDEKPIKVLTSSVASMLSVCLSTVICVAMMFILSTALLLLINN